MLTYFNIVIVLLALHPQEIFLNSEKELFAEIFSVLSLIKMSTEKNLNIQQLLSNLYYSHLLEYYVAIKVVYKESVITHKVK